MSHRLFRAVTTALAVTVAASATLPIAAEAERGRHSGYSKQSYKRWHRGGNKHARRNYDRVRFVAVRRPRTIVVRPTYVDYFVVRRPRFVVVRPVPYWSVPYGSGVSARIGVRSRGFNLNLAFQKQRPLYGCNFCDERFAAYDGWSRHVTSGCAHAPGVRVIAEHWDDDELAYYRGAAHDACGHSGDYGDSYGRDYGHGDYEEEEYEGRDWDDD